LGGVNHKNAALTLSGYKKNYNVTEQTSDTKDFSQYFSTENCHLQ